MDYHQLTKEQLIELLKVKEPKVIANNTDNLVLELRKFLQKSKTDFSKENFGIIIFNNKNEILKIKVLFSGTVDKCFIYPRELFYEVLSEKRAKSFVVFHNHPSGKLEISQEDIKLTSKIEQISKSLELRLLEHLIIDDYAENYIQISKPLY